VLNRYTRDANLARSEWMVGRLEVNR